MPSGTLREQTCEDDRMKSQQQLISQETFANYGAKCLSSLAAATELTDNLEEKLYVLKRMMEPWGDRKIGVRPQWNSDVCADGSPIEFSVAFAEDTVELRVLVEALPAQPTTKSAQKSAQKLTQTLVEEFGASDRRLRQIEDLFLPPEPTAGFAMMHAVIFPCCGPYEFKIYLNPEAQGKKYSISLIQQALARLGFQHAWNSIVEYARRGFELDKLVYLSLDLSDDEKARVKVYFRHYDLAPTHLDQVMKIARSHETGYLPDFCSEVTGHNGAFSSQPLVSNLTFVDPADDRPICATAYVPLWTYALNDATTSDRLRTCLISRHLPVSKYDACLKSIARRPLEAARGIHTYTSLRLQKGRPRITVYWSSELYDSNPPPRYQRKNSDQNISCYPELVNI